MCTTFPAATLRQLSTICASVQKGVIVVHKNPDGDAMGSALALQLLLADVYQRAATVIIPDSYPDYLRWMATNHTVINYDKRPQAAAQCLTEADYIFCLDFNDLSRTGAMEPLLIASSAEKVMIDHHLSPSLPAALTISCPELSSTCELLYHLTCQLGHYAALPTHWAELIYCGMMTDTGTFTYNASRPEIYTIISSLISKGIDKDSIYRRVYHNYSSWAVRFRGYIMSQKLNVFDDLHAAFFAITKEEMQQFHFIKGDAEGLVNVPLTIKGLRLSLSLREDDRQEDCVWVSIRSVGDVPANAMAEQYFNGGGHKNAAGGHLHCSLDAAIAIAKQAIKAFAPQLKNENNKQNI